MISTEVVAATPREGKFNKNAARRVRVAGKIPAVVYGAKLESIALAVDPKQIQRILYSETGHNTIFDLEIAGSSAKTKAMIVDWQYEPIKGTLMHIDLKRIAMDKAIVVEVPIVLQGISFGVKNEGGIMDQVLREVEIECLPGDIPSGISYDVSEMKMHETIRVKDLPHEGKWKFLTDEEATVAHVTAVKEEVVAEPTDVAATPAEPEVVKKGKQETEGAAPAGAAAPAAETKGAKK
jgi:large subunit ribosomal protein L25